MSVRVSYDVSHPISEGDHIVLANHKNQTYTVKVESGKSLKIFKDLLDLETFVGCNYGDIFTKEGNKWIKIERNDPIHGNCDDLIDDCDEFCENEANYLKFFHESPLKEIGDNRNIVDDNQAQKLGQESIYTIKKDGDVKKLITAIVENSTTFHEKTPMSREKYITRKKAKHLKLLEIRPCNLLSVCESYFNVFPHKIGYLGFPALSVMMYLADIRQENRVLVLDHSLGLITGAVAQRLSGSGRIYRMRLKGVSDKIVHELGIKYFENISSVDFNTLFENSNPQKNSNSPKADGNGQNLKLNPGLPKESSTTEDIAQQSCRNVSSDQPFKSELEKDTTQQSNSVHKRHSPESFLSEKLEKVDIVIGNISFNKCERSCAKVAELTHKLKLIADHYLIEGNSIVKSSSNVFLGGRFVAYGQLYQPMANCQAEFTMALDYTNVKLEEVFMREYQIKPLRTHPCMNPATRPCCGFILSATKIQSVPSPPAE